MEYRLLFQQKQPVFLNLWAVSILQTISIPCWKLTG